MIDQDLLIEFVELVPGGERSDFVNGALLEAVSRFKRARAMEGMDAFSRENKWSMTEKEIRKARNYGRE